MGLLDGLFPSDMPPETKRYMLAQGLLGLGAGLLKAGGPSRLPTDFGSALGAGLEQGIGSANASYGLRGQMTRNKLYDEQIKQLEQERTANEDFGKLWQQPAETPASPAPAMPTPSSAPQIGGDQLVSAVIRQESAGNPNAVSPKGATGLMQVMPATAQNPGFGVKPFAPGVPLNDPAENQRFGTDYLNAMKQRFNGDIEAALVAYNAGPGVADKWMASGKNPAILPAETRGYVQSIMGKLQSGQQPGAQQATPVRMAQAQPQTMTDATPQARNPNARMFGVTDEQWDSVGRLPMASRRTELLKLAKENRDRAFEMQKLGRVDTPEQEAQKLRIRQAGATNVTVQPGMQENEQNKTLGKGFGEQYLDLQKSSMNANSDIQRWQRLDGLLDQVNTGKWTGTTTTLKAAAKSLGIDLASLGVTDDVGPAQAAQALSREMALQMRNPSGGAGMPGAMSDSDRNYLESMTPGLEMTREGRKLIVDYRIRMAKREREIAKLAADYKARNNGVFDEGFYSTLAQWSDKNPVFNKTDAEKMQKATDSLGAINEAKYAISRGAPREAVVQRLRNNGIQFDESEIP